MKTIAIRDILDHKVDLDALAFQVKLDIYNDRLDVPDEYLGPYGFIVYVIRDGDSVLYVGKSSRSVVNRLLEHLGMGGNWRKYVPDRVGEFILDHRPESLDWQVDLMTINDCASYIRQQFPMFVNWDVDTAEQAMIETYRPDLNVQYNRDLTP